MSFALGDRQQTFNIEVTDDNINAAIRATIAVNIPHDVPATASTPLDVQVEPDERDIGGVIDISPTSLLIPEGGSSTLALVFNRETGVPRLTQIEIRLEGESPEAFSAPRSLRFARGETDEEITVNALDDTELEDLSAELVLRSNDLLVALSLDGKICPTACRIPITATDNNDRQLAFAETSYELEEGDVATVTLGIDSPTNADIQVGLASDDPANLRVDNRLTIQQGETTVQVTIEAVDDTIDETRQTYTISMTVLDGPAIEGAPLTVIIPEDPNDSPRNLSLEPLSLIHI